MKRARTQLSITFENFKISSLLTEIWQLKLQLKSYKSSKHTSRKWQYLGQNMILVLFTLFRIYMKNSTIFILYKILIESLWGRQLANKPAAFSPVHKPATNTVILAASQHCHHQNLTNLPTPHFEKLALARGRKSTGSECVLLKARVFPSVCFLNCPKLWDQVLTLLQ
jgi:hypothetical protein